MYLEYAVIAVLLLMVGCHACFGRTYSRRIREFDADIEKTAPETSPSSELEETVMDLAMIHAEAKADRTSNYIAIVLCNIYASGLAILVILSHASIASPIGWMSLLFLPVPAYMVLRHLYKANPFTVSRQQKFWNVKGHADITQHVRSFHVRGKSPWRRHSAYSL